MASPICFPSRFLACLLLLLFSCKLAVAEESFFLINGLTSEVIGTLGSHLDERSTPCSTFKIALSLMGYDTNILKDSATPIWDFQKGDDEDLEAWRQPQTPQTWIKTSCVWYSRKLALRLGKERMQSYLNAFEYGNRDLSGGLTQAWLKSSLQISPKEQVFFIQKMIQGKLPLSSQAIQMTKKLLFLEKLPKGEKLFGKTGLGTVKDANGQTIEIGWVVGWIEKDSLFFPFAYRVRKQEVAPEQRIFRVKQLWEKLSS